MPLMKDLNEDSLHRAQREGRIARPHLILASGSPRRAELLREYGYNFEVIRPPFDEPPPPTRHANPAQWAETVSLQKAESVAALVRACSESPLPRQEDLRPKTPLPLGGRGQDEGVSRHSPNNCWILAGDTVVAIGGRIFGKPADRADAQAILRSLAGTTHRVITGVTLLDAVTGKRLMRHDVTLVTMRPLSDREIADYLDTNAWQGKAGAYGIQDRGDAFVERIDGSFTNVVGFPMELIRRMLDEWTR